MQRNPYRFAWLAVLIIGATLACNMISGLGRDIREIRGTGEAIITEVQGIATQSAPMLETARAFATNEGGSLLQTARAVATENPGVLETAKAFLTEGLPELGQTLEAAATDHPELVETMKAAATDQPELVETMKALATRYAGGAGAEEDIPADVPLVDRGSIKNLYVAGSLITYNTTQEFKTVLDFYKAQMPVNGWQASDTGNFETEGTAMLSYQKGDRSATLIITGNAENNQVSVVIQLHQS